MAGQIAVVVATALLSSALTLGAAYLAFRHWWRPRLEAEIEARLRVWLTAAGGELGATVEDRVRRGVVAALGELASAEGLRGTAETLGRSGAEILARGLENLLKKR